MDKGHDRFIKGTQDKRNILFGSLAKVLIKAKVSANHLTFLSLLSGLTAIYYLFNSYWLFTLFALLHLLFDGLDGVVARIVGPTLNGKYFDLGTDTLISILSIIKVAQFLGDSYAYIVVILFTVAVIIHFLTKFNAPIIFIRTVSLIVLIIGSFPGFPLTTELFTLGYLVVGSLAVYSLARQLQYFTQN